MSPFWSSIFQREAGSPLSPPLPHHSESWRLNCFVAGANHGEACVCVWWVGVGPEEVGTVSALLFVIGCPRPVLHTGGDKSRLVHLTQSCGHSQSFYSSNQWRRGLSGSSELLSGTS